MGYEKDIYNPKNLLQYGFFTNVRFVRKEIEESTEYVVLKDSKDNEKKVYKELFEKHAKVISE